jgi:hypothetical protein
VRQEQQQPQYQAPTQQSGEGINPHRAVYKSGGAGRAVAFNFLIAMTTFQVLYWSWLKLESMEIQQEKGTELEVLEGELQKLTGKGISK